MQRDHIGVCPVGRNTAGRTFPLRICNATALSRSVKAAAVCISSSSACFGVGFGFIVVLYRLSKGHHERTELCQK